jgi:hypothetical protein
MPIRRPARKERRDLDLREFGWPLSRIAVLRHSTLPFESGRVIELDTTELISARPWGKRDRLAILAQFAAHLALLKRLSIPSGRLVAEEWRIVRQRNADPRLVRIKATPAHESFTAAVEALEEMASLLGLDSPAGWTKPEQSWQESFEQTEAQAGESAWVRRSAIAKVLSPGAPRRARGKHPLAFRSGNHCLHVGARSDGVAGAGDHRRRCVAARALVRTQVRASEEGDAGIRG